METPAIRIIIYEDKYQTQLIRMVKEAKEALGLPGVVRSDLYDIRTNYLEKGDLFWLAVGTDDQVNGCIGFSRIQDTDEAFLHRFYVRASKKHQGIGTALLQNAETAMKSRGIRVSRVHLGGPKEIWYESYAFYPKNGYREYAPDYMRKEL